MNGYTDEQLDFIHELEELAAYDGKHADDDFRTLIAGIQDEFDNIKRGAVRAGLEKGERLTGRDVLAFGASLGKDFPDAQKGCEVFVSVWYDEKRGDASSN